MNTCVAPPLATPSPSPSGVSVSSPSASSQSLTVHEGEVRMIERMWGGVI
jgi:hypothetical protein